MQTLQEYKCPCCGGAIAFDSTLQKMKCPYCDTEFEMEALEGYDAELQSESWIRNVKIVDLWAKSNSYNLHDVAWFKMPDGSLRLSKPRMAITAPDELGNVLFDGREMPAQEA